MKRKRAYVVYPEDGGDGHYKVDDVLDGRGGEVCIASQPSHLEDVDDVVHHNIGTLQLTIRENIRRWLTADDRVERTSRLGHR